MAYREEQPRITGRDVAAAWILAALFLVTLTLVF